MLKKSLEHLVQSAPTSADGHDLKILYRDENFIAVDKPAGMIVHRGWDKDPITVSDLVRDKIIGAQVFAVHRLDRATSGVLLFALNADSARRMQTLFQSGLVQKKYIALVRGLMKEEIFLDHPIKQRDKESRVEAQTRFVPIEHFDRWSLIECYPLTGKQHQIRRHLKHLSHPIVGDVRFGKGDVNRYFRETYSFSRMALHASSLQFEDVLIQSEFDGFL